MDVEILTIFFSRISSIANCDFFFFMTPCNWRMSSGGVFIPPDCATKQMSSFGDNVTLHVFLGKLKSDENLKLSSDDIQKSYIKNLSNYLATYVARMAIRF